MSSMVADDINVDDEQHLGERSLLEVVSDLKRSTRVARSNSSASSLSSVITQPLAERSSAVIYYVATAALVALLAIVVYILTCTLAI